MAQTATDRVAAQVRRLAEAHNVTAELDVISHMAGSIARLTGDIVELDNVEQLLVNLKRKGVLSKSEMLTLQGIYLQEKRCSKKPFETR
jgi:prefoldin subunit 5